MSLWTVIQVESPHGTRYQRAAVSAHGWTDLCVVPDVLRMDPDLADEAAVWFDESTTVRVRCVPRAPPRTIDRGTCNNSTSDTDKVAVFFSFVVMFQICFIGEVFIFLTFFLRELSVLFHGRLRFTVKCRLMFVHIVDKRCRPLYRPVHHRFGIVPKYIVAVVYGTSSPLLALYRATRYIIFNGTKLCLLLADLFDRYVAFADLHLQACIKIGGIHDWHARRPTRTTYTMSGKARHECREITCPMNHVTCVALKGLEFLRVQCPWNRHDPDIVLVQSNNISVQSGGRVAVRVQNFPWKYCDILVFLSGCGNLQMHT